MNKEFDGDFELKQRKEFIAEDHLLIHDWGFTDSYYVLMGNRIKLDMPGILLSLYIILLLGSLHFNSSSQTLRWSLFHVHYKGLL